MNTTYATKAKTVGQAVYEEFRRGQAIPFKEWDNLSKDVQNRWESAAEAGISFMAAQRPMAIE